MNSLLELHKASGARFGTQPEEATPLSYGDPGAEHLMVRSRGGFIDFSSQKKVVLKGSERVAFLQGLVTNDVAGLGVGGGVYALLLNAKGKILSDMRIYVFPNHLLLELDSEVGGRVVEVLRGFLVSEDVEIEDATPTYGLISIQGPRSRELLRGVLKADPQPLNQHHHSTLVFEGDPITVIENRRMGEVGFDLLTPTPKLPSLWESLVEEGRGLGIGPFGSVALETLRVEAGILRCGVDFDETTLPQEARLEKTISYTKGCYLGQEVVSRVTHMGRVNRLMVGLEVEGEFPPTKGDRLVGEGGECGFVTSGVGSPTLSRVIALGYVKRDLTESGTPLLVDGKGGVLRAKVVDLPFYRGLPLT